MSNNELFQLKSENVTLLQAMQLFLNLEEIEDLNFLLYDYAATCHAKRPNIGLQHIIYEVKLHFNKVK